MYANMIKIITQCYRDNHCYSLKHKFRMVLIMYVYTFQNWFHRHLNARKPI